MGWGPVNASSPAYVQYSDHDGVKNLAASGTVTLYAMWASNTLNGIETSNLKMSLNGWNNSGAGHNGSATTWTDLSGNNNNMTATSTTWGANYTATSGSASYYTEAASTAAMSYTNAVTLEARFSVDAWQSGASYIIGNANSTGYAIFVRSGGQLVFMVCLNSGTIKVEAPWRIALNTITNVSGTYDGTTAKLYINGMLVKTISNTSTIKI